MIADEPSSVAEDELPARAADTALPVLRLKRGEDRRLRAGHLWVFSNEVDIAATPLTGFVPGARARVHDHRDQFLGYAYVNPQALICARILSRSPVHPADRSLLVHRLNVALRLRERHYAAPYYRLVFGEGDGLPGLVLDRYGDVMVGQIAPKNIFDLRPDLRAMSVLMKLKEKNAHTIFGAIAGELELTVGDLLKNALLDEMQRDPKYWKAYYQNPARQQFDMQFSLSDRIRYYWGTPTVTLACARLIDELTAIVIPETLLSQYMPAQFAAFRAGHLKNDPRALILDSVAQVLRGYSQACVPSASLDHTSTSRGEE